ncbi:MFS transporter, DHA1 family, chloramphenicol resistance protein [Marinactinospora thermotolerans DSM 45154]|uniref:MFS transporter, DHA1 family, chloramphenicol resistance protein n=2 Tax=Marinactinospora thermotolerans TaxID=531310 RepID=A0A1T4KGR4_9ACTN|nr:MFS transporter, DHA1 family, chloramphenicol resistance protein [Marinactinospora thermotolerans DSM 45154]
MRRRRTPSMPPTVYLLALAVFAQGTSEFMLAGLVADISTDMRVPLSDAGLLTSAFAVGMAVGAPLMALMSRRWPRRSSLTVFLAVFALVHVLGAVTTDFGVLMTTRVLAALANAGFMAVGLATATALVPPNAKGRALAVLLGGTTIACVAGVPAGALLGELLGWRSAFWAVALVSLPALVAVVTSVPAGKTGNPAPAGRPSVATELGTLRRPRLLVTLVLGALVNGATFCTFTYLAPIVTDVAGIGSAWVAALLALFGVGSFLGVRTAGRLSDTRPLPLLVGGGVALLLGWVVFALAASIPAVVVALALVQGTLSFAVGGTLISQVLYAASDAPTLGGGFATASLNVGAAAGPWLGGIAIAAGYGLRSPLWVSALLVAGALVVGGAAWAMVRGRAGGARPAVRETPTP